MFFQQDSVRPVDVKQELRKLRAMNDRYRPQSSFFRPTKDGFQSSFFDPYQTIHNQYGNLMTADRLWGRDVDPWTLRRVAKKAWIINVCIKHIQDKIVPFLKPSSSLNTRGFVVHRTGEDVSRAAGKKTKESREVEDFLRRCGANADTERDDFQKFCLKIVRDALEIDQCATEIAYTRAGKPCSFLAVDGATVERVLPGQNNPLGIKYVQVINSVPQAFFPDGTLVFDYQNPRSDVRFAFYGYSPVEQAIDLVASTINTFNYNAGFFTENKLPRGMLLVDGNVSQEAVETMEDYICDMMSGPTSSQWHVPIIPSGDKDGSIKWVPLGGTNKEMEFQNWLDFLTSGVVALFGCSIDELGLHSQKSQPVFDHGKGPEIEESKGLVLGNTLGFLQQYVNKILALAIPGWEIEFVGYEKTDPQKLLDLAKGEVESYKTLNEVRKEKGLKPLASKWADECPANPQFMQMYQAENGGGQEGGMPGADGMDGQDGGMMESEPDEDGGDPWAGIGQPDEEDNEDGKKPSKGEEDYEAALLGDGKLGKSLPAVMSIRI